MNVQASASRIRSKLAIYALLALVLAFVAMGVMTYQWRADDELRALPTTERETLYAHTLETLQSTCTHPVSGLIAEYCREQAQFLTRFPECNDACQRTCRQFFARPTK